MKRVYQIEKRKTIPIIPKEINFPINDGKIIFNEEITIFVNGIYDNNRLRLIIHKDTDSVDVYSAAYEGEAGLCYGYFELSLEEYSQFNNLNEFIKKIFIEGMYIDRGCGIATGIKEKDSTKILEENNEYSLDI